MNGKHYGISELELLFNSDLTDPWIQFRAELCPVDERKEEVPSVHLTERSSMQNEKYEIPMSM